MIVIDDFYSDPYAIREAALQLSYDTQSFGAGIESHGVVAHRAMTKLASYIGDYCWWSSQYDVQCYRSLHDGHKGHPRPHEHGDRSTPSHFREWCAELTLTLPEHVAGTLDFFKCKHLNASILRRCDEETDFGRVGYEKLFSVPLKFNRCILFEANLSHTLSESAKVGTRIEDGSLTQAFSFFSGYNPDYNN